MDMQGYDIVKAIEAANVEGVLLLKHIKPYYILTAYILKSHGVGSHE